jgi:hypothetical protein
MIVHQYIGIYIQVKPFGEFSHGNKEFPAVRVILENLSPLIAP